MLLKLDVTLLASDEATPVELAPASFDDDPPACLEPTPAAHQLAAVRAGRLPVAEAAARAQRPCLAVLLAEVRRRVHEYQIGDGGGPEAGVAGDQFAAGAAALLDHLDGAVELVT